jgi:uncharacterized protein
MSLADLQNPFVIGTVAKGKRFTDRAPELTRLVRVLTAPGEKLVLYGERRMGKSSLLDRAAARARRTHPVVMVSLATASGVEDAAVRLLAAIEQAVRPGWRDVVLDIARSLTLAVTAEPSAEGGFSYRIGFDHRRPDTQSRLVPDVLDAFHRMLAKRGGTAAVVLDEFQRLVEWGGEDVEWALKAILEQHDRMAYVLAGSDTSAIEEMVQANQRGLYKLADTLRLGPLPPDHFARYLEDAARATGVRRFTARLAERIVELAGPRTYDVILLARAAWFRLRAGGVADAGEILDSLVAEQSDLHRRIWGQLGDREQRILRALATGPDVSLQSAETRSRHQLGPASSVGYAVSRLVEAERLHRDASDGSLSFDDPFFRRWVQVRTFADIGVAVPEPSPARPSVEQKKPRTSR